DNAIVGTVAAYSFQLTVPGGIASAAGVTFVSVRPSHRRRGILSAMMRHPLPGIAPPGEGHPAPVPARAGNFRPDRHRRAGWAPGQRRRTTRRGEGALTPAAARSAGAGHGAVRLRAGRPAELRAELAEVYDSVAPGRPGMMARDGRWWQTVFADPQVHRWGM